MIEIKTGNILADEAEALVNTVNCVGVMGRGIALQFKNAFPDNFKAYYAACHKELVKPGSMFVFQTKYLTNPKFIINFPTKRHWKGMSRIEDIDAGLRDLITVINLFDIKSIALPPLGSGLGGLDWEIVKNLMISYLEPLTEIQISIYEPHFVPETKQITHSTTIPSMTPGRAALIELMNLYLGGLLSPFVTLLEIHKLLFFLQEAGEQLSLKYQKSFYGPYAENLRHVLNKIDGHLISGYADGGDKPDKQIRLIPGAVQDAEQFLQNNPATKENFQKVADLVEGFESPFGLELLSTVYWIVAKENTTLIEDIISKTYLWSEHKRQFSPRQIKMAANVLSEKGWIEELMKQ